MVNESPVYFTRTQSMRPLPMPVQNGDVGLLWQHTNIPAHSRLMVLTWLLDCFHLDTPFPVLELVGEQGSAKSTTQSVLRSLVDPDKVMLRGRPKTVEDVFVAAANNWLVSYENLSGLTPEQQDAFCTLATGGGFASRQLYTNGEEHVMETKRPVVLNGIAVVATRPDLIDRVIYVDLPTIRADARRDDADTHAAWERDHPKVFAGLLDLFSAALAMLPTVMLAQKQRMADFERLGEAVARALGYAPGAFQQQYAELVRAGIDRALESNPVALALDKYIADRILPVHWQGTAGQLYDLLSSHSIPDRSSWPRSPKGLADQLRRSLPAEAIEALVVEQICEVLRAPASVQAVWDRVRESAIDLDQVRVVMPMRQLATAWPSLFPAEQRRLAQLLIERVLIGDGGLEILWRDAGWVALIEDLRPNSIGAELAEREMTV